MLAALLELSLIEHSGCAVVRTFYRPGLVYVYAGTTALRRKLENTQQRGLPRLLVQARRVKQDQRNGSGMGSVRAAVRPVSLRGDVQRIVFAGLEH